MVHSHASPSCYSHTYQHHATSTSCCSHTHQHHATVKPQGHIHASCQSTLCIVGVLKPRDSSAFIKHPSVTVMQVTRQQSPGLAFFNACRQGTACLIGAIWALVRITNVSQACTVSTCLISGGKACQWKYGTDKTVHPIFCSERLFTATQQIVRRL